MSSAWPPFAMGKADGVCRHGSSCEDGPREMVLPSVQGTPRYAGACHSRCHLQLRRKLGLSRPIRLGLFLRLLLLLLLLPLLLLLRRVCRMRLGWMFVVSSAVCLIR